MPLRDGTGPFGSGGRRGAGGGRMGGNKPGAGPGGYCVCPSCGNRMPHQVRTPCYLLKCSKCGAPMARE